MSGPKSSPVDARQVRTRQQLLDALLRLIEKRPFADVTIREIAKAADIGYATFFRHYPSKDALLADLATGEIADLLNQAVPVLFAKDTRAACVTLFAYVERHRGLWTAFLTGGAAAAVKAEFTAQARAIADAAPPVGGWLPDDLRVVYAVGATVEIIAWWLAQDAEFPVERAAEILDRLVVTPVIAAD